MMVFCMTVYTISLKSGVLNLQTFSLALREMWLEYIVVFCLIFFVITNTSKKLAFKILHPDSLQPIFITLAIQCFTVCQIVPAITLFATFAQNGFTPDWFFQWVKLVVVCFPMALCTQLFFVGSLVRFIFKLLFKKQLSKA